MDKAIHACAELMFTEKNGARSEDVLKVVLIITDGTQTYKGEDYSEHRVLRVILP